LKGVAERIILIIGALKRSTTERLQAIFVFRSIRPNCWVGADEIGEDVAGIIATVEQRIAFEFRPDQIEHIWVAVLLNDEPTNLLRSSRVALGPVISSAINDQPSEGEWHPAKSPADPVSIAVSAADHRAVVLRNGSEIGSAPVSVEGAVTGTWAYALRSIDAAGQHWLKLQVSDTKAGHPVPTAEWRRFERRNPSNAPSQELSALV